MKREMCVPFQILSKRLKKCAVYTHSLYYTLTMIILKSSGVLFIPLHAEHGYNEGHGAQDKSHSVSLQKHCVLIDFLWTHGIDCLVLKHMSVYVYGICYLKTNTTHSYIMLGFLMVSFVKKIENIVHNCIAHLNDLSNERTFESADTNCIYLTTRVRSNH